MPKSNYALVEESGFFSSNTKGQGYLAGTFFKNTLYLYLRVRVTALGCVLLENEPSSTKTPG